MEEIQNQFHAEVDNYKGIEKEFHKFLSQRTILEGQFHDNDCVKKELDLLKPEEEVFKLVGPVLVKQDITEAKQNVTKRIDYIKGEMKRLEDAIAVCEKKQVQSKEKMSKLEMQLKQSAVAGQPKS